MLLFDGAQCFDCCRGIVEDSLLPHRLATDQVDDNCPVLITGKRGVLIQPERDARCVGEGGMQEPLIDRPLVIHEEDSHRTHGNQTPLGA